MKENYVIGIIGGMGSYATVDFFRRLVDAFPAEKEWNRPRIIIDNFCTLPSRVKAVLYGEKKEELIDQMSSSVKNICIGGGVNRLILACNTSHVFLPEIEKKIPECAGKFIHIIDALAHDVYKQGFTEVYLVASEGTIDSGIYSEWFEPLGIKIIAPQSRDYSIIREWIEAVKQNTITNSVIKSFQAFIDACKSKSLILGCTELPILYTKALQNWVPTVSIFDPLESVINIIRKEYYS